MVDGAWSCVVRHPPPARATKKSAVFHYWESDGVWFTLFFSAVFIKRPGLWAYDKHTHTAHSGHLHLPLSECSGDILHTAPGRAPVTH